MMSENQSTDGDASFAAAGHPLSSDIKEMPRDSEAGHYSSCDSDSDDSDVSALDIETLARAVQGGPNDYDAHVKYIKSLRKAAEIEKLRAARESMSALHPLTPTMWQEWASDEASLSSGNRAFTTVKSIYERGVQEYLSVPLWCDYLNFIQTYDESVSQLTSDGVTKMRDLFERALISGGLHVIEGGKIWDAYREFEQAYLLSMNDADIERKAKQIDHIHSLFHRQLSVPLANMSSTLREYKQWEIEQGNLDEVTSDDLGGIPSNVTSAHKKAMEMYNSRMCHEERVSSSDVSQTERFQSFMSYIKFEERSGDPARIQVMYERAIKDFPVSSDLWLGYTNYMDTTLKVPNVIKPVYTRATRSCPWIGELWVRYLLSLERLGASAEELSLVFEQALQCHFSSFNEYLDLFLTRIDGLRRKFSTTSMTNNDQDYNTIRETFQRATEYLSPHLKGTNEILHLHKYWARLEVELAKDLVAARGVWESLIKSSGSLLEVWQGFIAMEVGLKHINETRSIFKRCYSKRLQGSGSKDICTSWLQFEREYGTLEDFDHAMRKVAPRLEELQLFQSQEAKHQRHPSLECVERKDKEHANSTSKKRKTDIGFSAMHPQPKQHRQTTKREPQIVSKQGEGSVDGLEPSLAMLRTTSVIDQLDEEKAHEDVKPTLYTDQCTAFISNISLDVTEEHLHDFFSDTGGVTAVRLLRDKFTGKSRGLAYVDFTNDEHLEAAIKQNKQKLFGKKVSIARSDPKHKRSGGVSSSSRRGGRASSDNRDEGRSEGLHEPSPLVSSVFHRRGGHIRLKGSNTFAVPRTISRSLGRATGGAKNEDDEDKPKSNDEFRKMLLRS